MVRSVPIACAGCPPPLRERAAVARGRFLSWPGAPVPAVARRSQAAPSRAAEREDEAMILQSTDELEDYIGNKYSLVIVAAKRARQIKEGHTPLSRDSSPNPLSIALREVQEQKLQSIAPPEEELAPAPRDVIASLVAGAGFDLDEDLDLEDSDAVDDLAALLIGADEEEEEEAEESDSDDPLATSSTADSEEESEDSDEESDDEVPLEEAEESDDEDEEEA